MYVLCRQADLKEEKKGWGWGEKWEKYDTFFLY